MLQMTEIKSVVVIQLVRSVYSTVIRHFLTFYPEQSWQTKVTPNYMWCLETAVSHLSYCISGENFN